MQVRARVQIVGDRGIQEHAIPNLLVDDGFVGHDRSDYSQFTSGSERVQGVCDGREHQQQHSMLGGRVVAGARGWTGLDGPDGDGLLAGPLGECYMHLLAWLYLVQLIYLHLR
jgi:hypothetical protein